MSARIAVLPGDKFGEWTVVGEGDCKSGHRTITCTCKCGTVADVHLSHLRSGASKGCKPCATITHGMSYTATLASWSAMRARCRNPNHRKYHLYGGRGIAICASWDNFSNFLADMGERPEGTSLDRIDGNSGYSKENCRWSTIGEQNNNKSTNVFVDYQGVRYTIAQLARHLGMTHNALYFRLSAGKQIDAPYKKRKRPK